MVTTVITDIHTVLTLTKIGKPQKITLIVAPQWKYTFFTTFTKQQSRHITEVIEACKDEKHMKEISKIVPQLLHNPGKVPSYILSVYQEKSILETYKNYLQHMFATEIIITDADTSSIPKAQQAMPLKPAIIVE